LPGDGNDAGAERTANSRSRQLRAPGNKYIPRRLEVARVLDEIFLSLWNGPYVTRLELGKKYIPPRIK